MRLAGKSAWRVGAFFLVGCGGGSLPQAREGENLSEGTRSPDSHAASSVGVPSKKLSCPDAPEVEVVVAQAERASENAREVDEYLKQLGQPPMPPAPYTVASAQKWINAVGQPWFHAQATRVEQFEKALDEFPEGTYAHARATITVAAAWEYLSKRRAPVPKLLMWLEDHDETGGGRLYDEAQVKSLFDLLPAGDHSRRRLALNLMQGYGSVPAVADLGPPEEQLPQGEQRTALRHFDSGFQHRASRDDFPWWTPLVSQLPGNNARPIQGVRVDLSDGNHFIIPYSDQGLDHCAMVHIAENGQRSPHRPPDVKKKCAARWAEEEGD